MDKHPEDSKNFSQLERILKDIESHGLKSLSSDDLMLFGQLYKRAAAALSVARTQGVNDNYIEYLNQLVSRAYGHIYVAESKGWPSVRLFFTREFPRSFRQNLPFILSAFLITLVAAVFAYGIVAADPGKADVVFGPGATQMIDDIAERHTGAKDWMPGGERPVNSSFIITNNIKVAASAFATGILAGALTFAILFYNGLMLGVIGAAVADRGFSIATNFWSFVAPHGIIELNAIFIAGGAGLMLGWALLCPGDYTRGTAIKLAAREAFKLILGVVAMLCVAGVIEAFFSPTMLPNALKLVVAGMIGVAEFSYLFLAGKDEPEVKAVPRASTAGTYSR